MLATPGQYKYWSTINKTDTIIDGGCGESGIKVNAQILKYQSFFEKNFKANKDMKSMELINGIGL